MKNMFIISGLMLCLFVLQSCKEKPTPPTLSTTAVSEISYTSAISGGNVTDEGGETIISRGICWNTSEKPTISDSKAVSDGGLGEFTANLTLLIPNTQYYVRAYATNSDGTGYGNQVSFTTREAEIPVLTTTEITSVTPTTAVSGGNITDERGAAVSTRGVCWSTSANPAISNNRTTDGTGTGSFASTIAGLEPGTKYYVRSYATNSAGTAYGDELNFTTLITVPTLTTTAVTDITISTGKGGGNITGTGGADVTARGVCWSTSQTPTVEDKISTDGSGTGNFSSNLTKLIAGTTYYTRAYATNSAGTAYGNVQSFETKNILLFSTTCTAGGSSVPNTLMQINPKNGTGGIPGATGSAKEQFSLDMDPITGSLYGVNPDFPGVITKIDIKTGSSVTASTINQSGTPVELWGITFNPEGILYGITGNHKLGIIDLNKGTFTLIKQITTENCVISGIDFSPDGTLYAIKNFSEPFENILITIDEKTGTVKAGNKLTSLYSIGDIDFSCDGYIYGTNFSWALMKINPIEFTITFIGFNSFGALGGIASSLK
jgi:hypothetical protein